MNIQQKLIEIKKVIGTLKKDADGYGYKFVSGNQILNKITETMNEHGVLLEPYVTAGDWKTFEYVNNKGVDKTDFVVTADMQFHWVNSDEPTDRIVCNWLLFGQQDDISKAFGSGLTYSERYFLLKYFGVPTDADDPDSQDTSSKTNNQPQKTNEKRDQQVADFRALLLKKHVSEKQVLERSSRETNKNISDIKFIKSELIIKYSAEIMKLADAN